MNTVGDKTGHVHFVGICGVGMAGLAYVLSKRGWLVSGCDANNNPLADWLLGVGVKVEHGHSVDHLYPSVTCVVVTPAVNLNEPELRAANERGISVVRRGEVLAEIMSAGQTVAVCGTHGKTTTSCFTTRLLQACGYRPAWCIGGTTRTLGAVAGEGDGHVLVAESDESDGTLAFYHPAVSVLMNLDIDHLEHFAGEEDLVNCFRRVIAQTRVGVAVCADHARAWSVAKEVARVPLISFGFSEQADVRAVHTELTQYGSSFDVILRGNLLGSITLPVSGQHNIINALGAFAAALHLGVPHETIFEQLPAVCSELPGRRFERISDTGGVQFVADYAHHPQELLAAIEMARLQKPNRLIVVFQPHRYTRTLALGPEFPAAFADADDVILLPVYAASEAPLLGGSSCDLYAHFRKQYPFKPVKLARSIPETWSYLKRTVQPGDFVLIAGAGDVIQLADYVRDSFGEKNTGYPSSLEGIPGTTAVANGDLSRWSTYGVGNTAQWRVEAENEEAMASVMSACDTHAIPVRLLGAGANSWVSDLGLEGCAVRLSKDACRDYLVQDDDTVILGCGWRGPALLDKLTADGWSGLEFLEGVPGSVGGWLAMNAGAHGGEIAQCVTWVRCIEPNGLLSVMTPAELNFSYRHCAGLQERVAVACALKLTRADPESINAKRLAIREKRIPLAGLRTAGSVFKNPLGESAGRLLDQAGCKGLRIGGATVTDFHANIIVVDDGACASDILSLMQVMQNRVCAATGILLEPEVQGVC
jgi:UDP-N-acetylmuramate--L-alanine ligase/UDP-N-acetylenolpyruvoylglucosamine reductase